MGTKLKPCPFCGGKYITGYEGRDCYVVYCEECHAKVEVGIRAMWCAAAVAYTNWNKRSKSEEDAYFYHR